jgi:hypothetical protein
MHFLRSIFAACALFFLTAEAFALTFQQSGVNLPISTAAFETRFDLDGDHRKDIIAIFQRRILIFFQGKDGSFATAPDVEIGAGQPIPQIYAAVAVGKMTSDPGLQLVLIGRNGADYLTVSQLRGNSSEPVEPRTLLTRKFDVSPAPDLMFLDAIADTDGDGKQSLILPNSDQLEFYTAGKTSQSPARKLYIPLQLNQRTSLIGEPSLFGSIALAETGQQSIVKTRPVLDRWYQFEFAVQEASGPLLFCDYNQDGRMDLISPRTISLQNPNGTFTAVPSSIYQQIAIPTYTSYANRSIPTVVAPNVVDFNGDAVLDTFKIESSAAKFSPRTDVSVFLGKPDRTFADQPDFVLRTRDLAYSDVIPIGDLNRDGAQDIALFHFDFQPSSPSSQLKAYLRNGLDGELRAYLWDKRKNRFPEGPSFRHRVTVNYGIYGARQLFQQQVVMNRDMDGDKFPDLVMKTGSQEISVFKNNSGHGFSSNPISTIHAPTRFSSLYVDDLNGDGIGDVIVSGYLEDQDDRVIYSFFISQ